MLEDRRVVARLSDGITVVSVVDSSHHHRYGLYRNEILVDEYLTLRDLLHCDLLASPVTSASER